MHRVRLDLEQRAGGAVRRLAGAHGHALRASLLAGVDGRAGVVLALAETRASALAEVDHGRVAALLVIQLRGIISCFRFRRGPDVRRPVRGAVLAIGRWSFSEGEFRFDVTTRLVGRGAGRGCVVVAAAIFTYRRVQVTEGRVRDRVILTALRIAALGLVLFCLFRPTLVVRAAVNQQNVVAVLLDDSRSMQIPDWGGSRAATFVKEQFGTPESPLHEGAVGSLPGADVPLLVDRATRMGPAKELTSAALRPSLARARRRARRARRVCRWPGGAGHRRRRHQRRRDRTSLLALKAQKLPVFTVGVGSEQLPRDMQIDRVSTPRTVLKDASLLVDVVVRKTGYGGRTVTVDVEDEGRIVGSRRSSCRRRIAGIGASAGDGLRAGPAALQVPCRAERGELVTQNNVRESLMNVRDARERILYFEGEPRFEMKFLRRAVADDKNLEVVGLQRTADNKYMRSSATSPIPKNWSADSRRRARSCSLSRPDPRQRRGRRLLGRSAADDCRLRRRRGGGLLMLGGARSFGEGGYGGTPVADALPLLIDPRHAPRAGGARA